MHKHFYFGCGDLIIFSYIILVQKNWMIENTLRSIFFVPKLFTLSLVSPFNKQNKQFVCTSICIKSEFLVEPIWEIEGRWFQMVWGLFTSGEYKASILNGSLSPGDKKADWNYLENRNRPKYTHWHLCSLLTSSDAEEKLWTQSFVSISSSLVIDVSL